MRRDKGGSVALKCVDEPVPSEGRHCWPPVPARWQRRCRGRHQEGSLRNSASASFTPCWLKRSGIRANKLTATHRCGTGEVRMDFLTEPPPAPVSRGYGGSCSCRKWLRRPGATDIARCGTPALNHTAFLIFHFSRESRPTDRLLPLTKHRG